MPKISRDIFAPTYRLTVGGGDIVPREVTSLIERVTYEDEGDLTDKLTILLTTQAVSKTKGIDKELAESKIFAEGNEILLEGGYGKELEPIGKVEIIKRTPIFPRGAYPKVLIVGYDPFHRMAMRQPEKGVSFKEFRDSQIATTIASKHKIDFSKVKFASGKFNRIQKKGVSDLAFLREIADERGFDLFLRYNKDINKHQLFFEKPTDRQKEVFTFNYAINDGAENTTLLDFRPTINTFDQPSQVQIIHFDRETGTKKTAIITQDDVASQGSNKFGGTKKFGKSSSLGSGGAVRAKVFGESIEIIANKPFKNEKDARNFAIQWLRKRGEEFITGSGHTIGLEVLQSRQTHNLEGIDPISGKYYFTRVTHDFANDSYECGFDARKII